MITRFRKWPFKSDDIIVGFGVMAIRTMIIALWVLDSDFCIFTSERWPRIVPVQSSQCHIMNMYILYSMYWETVFVPEVQIGGAHLVFIRKLFLSEPHSTVKYINGFYKQVVGEVTMTSLLPGTIQSRYTPYRSSTVPADKEKPREKVLNCDGYWNVGRPQPNHGKRGRAAIKTLVSNRKGVSLICQRGHSTE